MWQVVESTRQFVTAVREGGELASGALVMAVSDRTGELVSHVIAY